MLTVILGLRSTILSYQPFPKVERPPIVGSDHDGGTALGQRGLRQLLRVGGETTVDDHRTALRQLQTR